MNLVILLCAISIGTFSAVKSDECPTFSFLGSSPFFRMAPARFQSQQILFLTEFSRYMNKHAPTMLKDFVDKKKIYQAERTVQKLKRYDMSQLAQVEDDDDSVDSNEAFTDPKLTLLEEMHPVASFRSDDALLLAGTEQTRTIMDLLLTSTQEAIKMAKNIVKAVEHSADRFDLTSPDFWETACKSEWWPFDDKTCIEIRCTACAPSIMSAGAVCDVVKKNLDSGRSHYRCMQKVMGEGFCNYCIIDYLES